MFERLYTWRILYTPMVKRDREIRPIVLMHTTEKYEYGSFFLCDIMWQWRLYCCKGLPKSTDFWYISVHLMSRDTGYALLPSLPASLPYNFSSGKALLPQTWLIHLPQQSEQSCPPSKVAADFQLLPTLPWSLPFTSMTFSPPLAVGE